MSTTAKAESEFSVSYDAARYPHSRKTERFATADDARLAFCALIEKCGNVAISLPGQKLLEFFGTKGGAVLARLKDSDGYYIVELWCPTAGGFYSETILCHDNKRRVANAYMDMFAMLCAAERALSGVPQKRAA